MPHVATVDGVMGPDRQVHLELNDVTKIEYDFGHSVVNITQRNGNLTTYDLIEVGMITTSNENGQFLFEMKRKGSGEGGKAKEVKKTDEGPVEVGKPSIVGTVPKKADFPPKK